MVNISALLIPLLQSGKCNTCNCENTAENQMQGTAYQSFPDLFFSYVNEQEGSCSESLGDSQQEKQKDCQQDGVTAQLYTVTAPVVELAQADLPNEISFTGKMTHSDEPAKTISDIKSSHEQFSGLFETNEKRQTDIKTEFANSIIQSAHKDDSENTVSSQSTAKSKEGIPPSTENDANAVKNIKSDFPRMEGFRILHSLSEQPHVDIAESLKTVFPEEEKATLSQAVPSVTAEKQSFEESTIFLEPYKRQSIKPTYSYIDTEMHEVKQDEAVNFHKISISYTNEVEKGTDSAKQMQSDNNISPDTKAFSDVILKSTVSDKKPLQTDDNAELKVTYGVNEAQYKAESAMNPYLNIDRSIKASQSIVDQITTAVQPHLRKGADESFKIKLKPEGLGEIYVELRHNPDKLDIRIKTELTSTGELLNDSIDELRIQLAANSEKTSLQVSSFSAKQEVGQMSTTLSGSLAENSEGGSRGRYDPDTRFNNTDMSYNPHQTPLTKTPETVTRLKSKLIDCLA